jgi:hypothetical protein
MPLEQVAAAPAAATSTAAPTEIKETTAPSGAVSDSSPTQPPAGGAGDIPAKAAAASPTLAGGADAAAVDAGKADAADAVDDWRAQLAGSNKDDLKALARYTSMEALWNAHKALRAKMSSGELKAVTEFPAEGTPEEQKAWRAERSIPEAPEGYEPKVEGLVFGDADKPMLDSFQKHAHGKNWTPAQFNEALAWYAAEQEQIKTRQAEADETSRSETREALIGKWGSEVELKRNINAINNLFASAPEDFKNQILGARLPNGKLLGNDAQGLEFLAGLSREIDPAATLIPPGSSNQGKTVETELEGIRKLRRENPDAYDADKKLQARELELLDAKIKMDRRNAA